MNATDLRPARHAILFGLVIILAGAPIARASVPEGLAARLHTGLVSRYPTVPSCTPVFYWRESMTLPTFSRTDSVTLDMAIIPFEGDNSSFHLRDAATGDDFASLHFTGGVVTGETFDPQGGLSLADGGVAYDPSGWNDVRVDLRFATQDYFITVNGQRGGPFPFFTGGYGCLYGTCYPSHPTPCVTGCLSVGGFSVYRSRMDDKREAWIDSISVTRAPELGSPEVLFEASFDDGTSYRAYHGTVIPTALEPGPTASSACPSARGLLEEIGISLTTPELRHSVKSSFVEKLRGATRAVGQAESKVIRLLEKAIPVLEIERGRALSAADSDRLLVMAQAVLDAAGADPHGATGGIATPPGSFVGRLMSGLDEETICRQRFGWYEPAATSSVGNQDSVTLELQLIPFHAEDYTSISLHGMNGLEIFSVSFRNGEVWAGGPAAAGIPYDPTGWNDVRIDARWATWDLMLTINGQEAGPFPMIGLRQRMGSINVIEGFSVHGDVQLDPPSEIEAWIDSIVLTHLPASGPPVTLADIDFDTGPIPHAGTGKIFKSQPPETSNQASAGCVRAPLLMKELGELLSTPATRPVASPLLIKKVRQAAMALHGAEVKASDLLERLIPVLEAGPGDPVPAAEADAIIAAAVEALARLSTP